MTTAVLHIMLALADGPRHGYDIMRWVADHSGGRTQLGPATLYRSLSIMVREGTVEEIEANEESRRRPYRLTRQGRRELKRAIQRLEQQLELARELGLASSAGRSRS